MLNFTTEQLTQIKSFADWQFDNCVDTIKVLSSKHATSVTNPWYDSSARFELTTEQAEKEWGAELVRDFCKSAWEYIESNPEYAV